MRFSVSSLLLALLAALAFASYADTLSIQARDTELDVREASPGKAVFEYVGDKEVMAPDDAALVRRVSWTYNNNQNLFMTSIVTNAGVAVAACGTGSPEVCAIGVAYSVLLFFFSAYIFSDRADTGEIPNPFFVYPPLPGQRLVQRLSTELEQGKWHYVGHVHHNGLNHTVEYFNTGEIQRLRARNVPFWNETQGLGARQSDPDNDGGFVGDYSWLNNNEGPYDSFHSTTDGTSFFAANAGGWMVGSGENSIAACASFSDSDGVLDNGLLTLGWNNQEFEWTEPGEENSAYSTCAAQE